MFLKKFWIWLLYWATVWANGIFDWFLKNWFAKKFYYETFWHSDNRGSDNRGSDNRGWTVVHYSEYTYEQKRQARTPLSLQACFVKAHSYGGVITSSCDEGEIMKQAGRDEGVTACLFFLISVSII